MLFAVYLARLFFFFSRIRARLTAATSGFIIIFSFENTLGKYSRIAAPKLSESRHFRHYSCKSQLPPSCCRTFVNFGKSTAVIPRAISGTRTLIENRKLLNSFLPFSIEGNGRNFTRASTNRLLNLLVYMGTLNEFYPAHTPTIRTK